MVRSLTRLSLARLVLLPSLWAVTPATLAEDCECDNSPQTWDPQPAKAALMLIFCHADDEAIAFRGVLPYYNTVRGMPVIGVCTSNPGVAPLDLTRRDELHAAFWTYGMRNPPLFAGMPDNCFGSCPSCTINSWGFDNIVRYLTEQIRRYQPEVIVSHDFNGERDHHSNHIVTMLAAHAAYLAAPDPSQYPDQLAGGLTTWQPKKLYSDKYIPNSWIHDWHTRYPQLDDRSAVCVAEAGLRCHVTQGLDLRPDQGRRFGLVETEVGFDTLGGDFLENIGPQILSASADVTAGPSGLTVHFSGEAITFGANPPTYEWVFGDGDTSPDPNASHTYNGPDGVYYAYLAVSDGILRNVSTPIPILIGQPPVISNVAPGDGALFHAGDQIELVATASDPDGTLDPNDYEWTIWLEYDGLRDPAFGPFTGPSASFTVPTSGVDFSGDAHYRVELRVTDSDGLLAEQVIHLWPEQVELLFDTSPAGRGLRIDGASVVAPYLLETVVAAEHVVEAPDGCRLIDSPTFLSWSDAGAQAHMIVAPAMNTVYTAAFALGPACVIDFEDVAVGADPPDWFDTQAAPSSPNGYDDECMLERADLFQVFDFDGSRVLGTASPLTNIHSHYIGPAAHTFKDFELSGRMWHTSNSVGIGVTFLSDFPFTDRYYTLRRGNFLGGTWQIYTHGAHITGGTLNSGVFASANTWWRFRIQVEDTGAQTQIRARVWQDGTPEPENWQINCFDDSPERLTSGTIGVWAMVTGNKYWDDLRLVSLHGPADTDGDGVPDADDDDPLDPLVCRDLDADGCDDCSVTGGPPDPANDGPDTDGDGICDASDCPGDLTGDQVVNVSDLGALLKDFGCTKSCAGDLDVDDDTDVSDLGVLLSHFGNICD